MESYFNAFHPPAKAVHMACEALKTKSFSSKEDTSHWSSLGIAAVCSRIPDRVIIIASHYMIILNYLPNLLWTVGVSVRTCSAFHKLEDPRAAGRSSSAGATSCSDCTPGRHTLRI